LPSLSARLSIAASADSPSSAAVNDDGDDDCGSARALERRRRRDDDASSLVSDGDAEQQSGDVLRDDRANDDVLRGREWWPPSHHDHDVPLPVSTPTTNPAPARCPISVSLLVSPTTRHSSGVIPPPARRQSSNSGRGLGLDSSAQTSSPQMEKSTSSDTFQRRMHASVEARSSEVHIDIRIPRRRK
jgi:hypothetical protein